MTETMVHNNNTSLIQYASSLQYLIKKPEVKPVNPKGIILIHGVGSNEQSLFQFAPHLPDHFTIIAPRGPFTIGEGKYAWYQVDFITGKPFINAEQETHSRIQLKNFVTEMKQKYGLKKVYLGGFSQGAIMSYSVGLNNPTEVTGIFSIGGRILHEIMPLVQMDSALQQLKVLVVHGIEDRTLPLFHAREAREYLHYLGVKLYYHEFCIGHTIDEQVLNELIHFLNE